MPTTSLCDAAGFRRGKTPAASTLSRTLRRLDAILAGWVRGRQGFELTRQRTARGVTTVEVIYGVTSLPPDRCGAARPPGLARLHWAIEHELHPVRGVTPREDAGRVRSGAAPQAPPALRNAVVRLLARVEAAGRRRPSGYKFSRRGA